MLGKLMKFMVGILFVATILTACGNDNDNAGDTGNTNTGTGNTNDNISSISTDTSSKDYPHTQPIKKQEAKYDFKPVPEGKENLPNGDRVPNTNNIANEPLRAPQNNQQPQTQQQQPTQQAENHGLSEFESEVVTLTNRERTQAGLAPLEVDTALSNVAREKSNDMHRNNYFSHTSPTYGSPFDMMRDFGITYQSAGENIAAGQQTPAEVVQAWMNSQGHRENILNGNFTHIGVGYNPEGRQWTQMFIRK
ncbi:CAP domain-containing protein [Ornithinibacillus halotolerans]|uniref:SCP domain-containing protein n=1 Tax=Ornithinibacillus halotolerans TaxID=1274357 RepID=A0A916S926_9BACI|nr:CAP domain-containing protein [Ornithinibacillus halotolerans]GGA89674.1 hypothetical protein GCM10008025_35350 [Ornithinibacillus halotolerans]